MVSLFTVNSAYTEAFHSCLAIDLHWSIGGSLLICELVIIYEVLILRLHLSVQRKGSKLYDRINL